MALGLGLGFGPERADIGDDGEDDGSLSEREQLLRRPCGAGDLAALREAAKRLASRGALVAGLFCAACLACVLASSLGGQTTLRSSAAPPPRLRHVSVASSVSLREHERGAALPNSTAAGPAAMEDGLPDLPRVSRHQAALRKMVTAAPGTVVPQEDRHDGNVCAEDEEFFGKLCYKKCSLITSGVYPFRSSAMSCCKAKPCTPFNSRLSFRICSGFDVAGDSWGRGACPHELGACLVDEELYLGMCFKKCSTLTSNEYPVRVAAATCCKADDLSCMEPGNSMTSQALNVGGGRGDGNSSTPAEMHPPMQSLTEEVSV